MITEQEAKTKWCQFVHSTHTDLRKGFHERYPKEGDPNAPCIGSRCMSWRWFDSVSDDGTACHMSPTKHIKRHPDNNPAELHPLDQRRGYCGLAGTPT